MSEAGFNAQMATSDAIVPERDLILGFTRAGNVGAPGMIALSKIVPPTTTFAQADLAGPWRVYMQRVESKLAGGTWQIGLSTFGTTGAFTGATLEDVAGVTTALTTGSLVVAGNGSVTGTLATGTAATAHRYEIRGTLRGLKDLVTGVVTARLGPTSTYQGLVTLVREVTLLDLGQPSYSVVEGQPARVTVTRTGNQAGTVTVDYAASGGTAPTGNYTVLGSGTLTFPPNASSRTFDVATTNDGVVQGSRTVNLIISDPTGMGAVLGPQTTALLTIQDNDVGGVVKFGTPSVAVLEGVAAALTLTRSGGTGGNVSVQWTTADGTATAGSDYAGTSGTVTFGPGEMTKPISIATFADLIPTVEGDETFRVTLHTPVGLTIGTPAGATVTVLDAQPGIQFGAAGYTVTEAMASAAIAVVRTGPATGTATVRYSTSPGNASAGTDYTAVQGVVTFAANARTATFMVPILPDTQGEGAETVLLTLMDPSPPAQLLSQRTATLTIVDNDTPGVIKLGAAAYTVAESAKTVLITVQRAGNADGVTVSYATTPGTATAGQDYLTASGTLTFGAAETTKTIAVTILNDALDEPAETFTVTLSNPGGGATLGSPASAVVTITDEDVPGTIAIGTAAVTVGESAGVVSVAVTRTGGMAGGVTVDFATADGSAQAGSDYTARSGRLTFNAGETSKLVAVAILDDQVREGDETFTLTLSNPGGGAALGPARVAVVTIRDDEVGPTVQFAGAAFSVSESAGNAVISVTRTGSVAAGQTVVVRTTTAGTAPPVDFSTVNQTVTFAAGQAVATVPLAITPNGAIDGDRTVVVELANPSPLLSLGAPRVAVLTIRDDDSAFRFGSPSHLVLEGATATLTVQRIGGAITAASVKYATVNGTAAAPGQYAAKTGTLMFVPGVTSQTITVTTVNDTVARGDRDFTVVLSDAIGATLGTPGTASVEIQENDSAGTVQFNAATYSVLEGGLATITVTRMGGAAGPLTVGFATVAGGSAVGGAAPGPGVDYVTRSGTLTFGAGATGQTFTIQTVPDTLAEGAKTVNLALSVPVGSAAVLGAPSAAVLTIVDDEQPRLQFAAATATVSEGAGVATLTVMRVGPTTGTHTVGYGLAGVTATAGVDFNATGGTLTFTPGIASRTITVPVVTDTINENAETFTVTLTGPSAGAALGAPSVATVTITDDDPAGTVQFSASSYSVIEGASVTLTVTRTGTAGPVTVAYAVNPGTGTATAAADYLAASGTLTFAAGESTRTITGIGVLNDTVLEGAEFFDVVLGATTGGLVLGTPSRARVWILDEEQSLQFSAVSYSVVEGGVATVTVTRVGVPAGTLGATVTLGGTAVAGVDYVVPASLALTFPSGVVTQTLTIQTLPDTVAEGGRTITLGLTGLSGPVVVGTPATATLTIVDNERPDLAVTAVSGPAQAATGLPTTVTAVVRNLAAGAAPASKLGVFLSSSSAVPGAGTRIALVDVPGLAALASTAVTGAVTIPGNLSAGTYFLSVVADALGAITEENESNNGLTAGGQVDVVVLLPDLIVTTVQPPGNTLSGKLVSSPLQVRNAGLVASGPYRVGVFLSTDPTPGTGTLLAIRDMPPLAGGAGADVPVSLVVPDDLPQGAYFMSGVVDLNGAVAEVSEANNALASAVPFQVTRNLTKLTSVSASFSTAAASPSCSAALANQTLNLTGTLSLATQTGTTGQGTIVLSGPVTGGTVTFRGPFSATVNLDETVTFSFTATVSGAFTGTATASGNGTIASGVLTGNVTNGLLTVTAPPLGSCPFTGPLTATGQPVYFFSLLHFAQGGGFNGLTTPVPTFPLPITEFSVALTALFDPLGPVSESTVTFNGPAGSGIVNVSGDRRQDFPAGSFYETDTFPVFGRTLTGPWSVRYRNTTKSFTVTNPETEQRFVAMLPTVTLNAAQTHVVSISWVFKNRTTGATVPAPPHADAIQIEFTGFNIDYASPDFPRTVTSHTLPTPLPVADLDVLYISYKDSLTGHFYVTTYTQ